MVACLMEQERAHDIAELAAGAKMIEKIASFRMCEYGADLATLHKILEHYYTAARKKMTRVLENRTERQPADAS